MSQIEVNISGRLGTVMVLFDECDREAVEMHTWYAEWRERPKTFYIRATVLSGKKARNISMHRYLLGLAVGDKIIVDHRNQNGADNRRENLRRCSREQNQANTRIRSDNSTGYKGVQVHGRKYQACIRINGRKVYLGIFASPELAAQCYSEALLAHHGEFARLV